MNHEKFIQAVEVFPWESKEQKEGYLALVQYRRKFGLNPEASIDPERAFFIQKMHEAHEYWVEMVGTQISALQDEIKKLKGE